jgi:hypothetical protein
MSDRNPKQSIITNQKAIATANGTLATTCILRGRKVSDNTVFVRAFANYSLMENWLNTFESEQYRFE